MTSPIRKDDFYVPTLQVLRALGGSATIEEIEEKLIESLGFTQAQLDETYETSGDNVITDKMSWARSYLKFPQFIINETRGVWVLTEAGRAAADQPVETVRRAIRDAKARRRAEQLAERAKGAGAENAIQLSEPGAEEAEEEAIGWTDELLRHLRAMAPDAFERLAQRLLRESGFVRVEVTGKSGDGGIDGSGVLRMNLISGVSSVGGFPSWWLGGSWDAGDGELADGEALRATRRSVGADRGFPAGKGRTCRDNGAEQPIVRRSGAVPLSGGDRVA